MLNIVLPYLTYCAEIWGVACKIHLDKVKVLQKTIVRIICGVGKREHSWALFYKMRLIKFTDLVDFKIAVIMFKANRRLLPPNIQDRFIDKLEGRSFSLRNNLNFKSVYTRTSLKKKCLNIYGVKVYSELPLGIKE